MRRGESTTSKSLGCRPLRDRVVIERILELEVNCVTELNETSRGSRGFGYSAHEELYPWAEPDDPLY